MSREVKFRAWDAKYRHLAQHEEIHHIDFINEHVEMIDGEGDEFQRPFEELELMQYTGLKDKNGVEIYEGDIVKIDDQIGAVEYDRYAFTVSGFYRTAYDVPSDAFSEGLDECEVIGNIYSNPELLEDITKILDGDTK